MRSNFRDEKTMPLAFGSSDHWRDRAKEARALADQITDPEAKQAMVAVAESYEKIAKRAEIAAASRSGN
jgi:hypothetical protein